MAAAQEFLFRLRGCFAAQETMTENREKRTFWYLVLMTGLAVLVISLFGERGYLEIEFAGGMTLAVAALLRLGVLKRQRRRALVHGSADGKRGRARVLKQED